jgi:cell division protein YceG involved in septum cleavage
MPKTTRTEKQVQIQEQIKELQKKYKEIEKKKHQDIGKYFCDTLEIENDSEAFEIIDKMKESIKDNPVQVKANEG